MKALIISAVLAAISNNAYADWSLLEDPAKSPFSIYIENDSIKKTGLTSAKAWFLLDFKKPEKIRKGSYLSSKELIEFDCKDDKTRLLASIRYSQKMGAGKSIDNFDGANADWSFAAPDTISADLLKLVCKTAFNEAVSNNPPIHVDIIKLKTIYQPNVNSYYPSASKRSGEMGQIDVRIIVGESGVVESADVLRTSGFPKLDQAAIEVSRSYRFEPYLVNFVPTRVSTSLLISFN